MDAILIFDVGLNRVKVSYVNRDGSVAASTEATYLTGTMADWVEQEPRDWWYELSLAYNSLKEKAPEITPFAIGCTGYAGILLLMGEEDRIDAAILPNDNRAAVEWQAMVSKLSLDVLLSRANNVYDAGSHMAKLLWLKKHQPTNYNNAHTLFLGSHDYIAYRLCGARVTDYTTASATDLFDIQHNRWAADLLERFDLRSDWLPDLVDGAAQVGALGDDAASRLGLQVGIPVFHGVADTAALFVGAGAHKPNQYVCYLGYSGWLGVSGQSEMGDPVTGIMNLRDLDPRKVSVIGPMVTAAGNFEWLKERFGTAEEKVFADEGLPLNDLLMTLAAEAVPGSGGVIYLPYLAGERSPYRDPNARGGWLFVSRKTWRSDLYRALLEGVAYSMRAIQLLLPEPPQADPVELRVIGGESASPLWLQIFADVFDCQVELLSPADDVAARGAAWLAGKTLGWFDAEVPDSDYIHAQATYAPYSFHAEVYERMFQRFCKIYPALYASFSEMAPQSN